MEASALAHPVGLGRMSLAGPLLRLRSDEQLVALFRAGHDEAFGTIHERYRARLLAYARQMLGGSRSDAEDVLQDVFLRAYNALRTDARDVALRAWLYRVAHNRCIDQLRRPAPTAEDIYDINRGLATDLLAEAERREDLRRLIADVRALPEQQRSALLMREMEGLSYNDLAAALGVTVPAVKSLLVRARVGLVEANEARDAACVEIRDDLASAFDRGVRPSGRAKRHLKDCAGCRDYRGALRGLDKSLNGLALPSGPLTTVMKVLGIGGAGSGAAAGGGAAVVGGGGAGSAAVAGGAAAGVSLATTVSGGVVAATATKVVAVVAAAAVVGGGAAVEKHHAARHPAAVAAPVAHVAAAPQRREDLTGTLAAGVHVKRAATVTEHGATRAGGTQVTKLQSGSDGPLASSGVDARDADQTTGGTTAPDDAAPDPALGDDGTGTTGTSSSGTDDTTAGSDATTTASGAGSATGTETAGSTATGSTFGTATSGTTATQSPATASGTTSSSSGSGATATGTGGTATPATGGTSAQTSSSPVAQGASANPSQPTG